MKGLTTVPVALGRSEEGTVMCTDHTLRIGTEIVLVCVHVVNFASIHALMYRASSTISKHHMPQDVRYMPQVTVMPLLIHCTHEPTTHSLMPSGCSPRLITACTSSTAHRTARQGQASSVPPWAYQLCVTVHGPSVAVLLLRLPSGPPSQPWADLARRPLVACQPCCTGTAHKTWDLLCQRVSLFKVAAPACKP